MPKSLAQAPRIGLVDPAETPGAAHTARTKRNGAVEHYLATGDRTKLWAELELM